MKILIEKEEFDTLLKAEHSKGWSSANSRWMAYHYACREHPELLKRDMEFLQCGFSAQELIERT